MDSTLLRNLTTGAGSSGQFIGGLIVALLYAVKGCKKHDCRSEYLHSALQG